jgi:hypothetical protein
MLLWSDPASLFQHSRNKVLGSRAIVRVTGIGPVSIVTRVLKNLTPCYSGPDTT